MKLGRLTNKIINHKTYSLYIVLNIIILFQNITNMNKVSNILNENV